MELLSYMFRQGNIIDVGWFLVGVWLLLLFFGMLGWKIFQNFRRRDSSANSQKASSEKSKIKKSDEV